MLLAHLINLILGHLWLEVRTPFPERFINMSLAGGIRLWNIERLNGGLLRVRTRPADFSRLRSIARSTHARVKILRRGGLTLKMAHLRRRWGLIAGALLFVAILYQISTFVWFIDVRGTETLKPEEIIAEAEAIGIRPGIRRASLDLRQKAEELRSRIPEVAWVSLSLHGTKLRIELAERTLPPPELPAGEGDIVAVKDGMVRKLLVLSGQALVSEGDVVTRGQTLIKGFQDVISPGPGHTAQGVELRARGEVIARVWYEARAPIVTEEVQRIRTGEVYLRRLIKIGGREIIVEGRKKAPFPVYDQAMTVRSFRLWRNFTLPVELINIHYHEVLERQIEYDRKVAEEIAKEKARGLAMAEIPRKARIVKVEYRLGVDAEGREFVRAIIECDENIGVLKIQT